MWFYIIYLYMYKHTLQFYTHLKYTYHTTCILMIIQPQTAWRPFFSKLQQQHFLVTAAVWVSKRHTSGAKCDLPSSQPVWSGAAGFPCPYPDGSCAVRDCPKMRDTMGYPKKTNGFFDENDDQSDKDMDF